jgi:excisionase family DNA binding protein
LATAPALPEDRLLKISEAARRLDCSPEWVRILARRGDLELHKLGPKSYRVSESSLSAYIARARARE